MTALDCTVQLSGHLETWSNDSPTGDELVSLLTEIAEVLEKAVEAYLKCDPDPLDTRHPSSVHPDCPLGHMLKKIFKAENFVTALFTEYLLLSTDVVLNTVSCRLVLDMVPGLKHLALRTTEGLIEQFFKWAERAPSPLSVYAIGILASLIENHQDIASDFKDQITRLAPTLLERLKDLNREFFGEDDVISTQQQNPSSSLSHKSGYLKSSENPYQMFPLLPENEQHYILLYLASIGEYQEFISFVFKDNEKVLQMLMKYIDEKRHCSIRLAFTALKFIAVLVSHKKCALEFLSKIGIQHILQVPRVPSIAAVGVSLVFYYLACNEDAIQRICVLPEHTIKEIMKYALWLLSSSHNSGRVHATVFIALTVQFAVIRKLFDKMDGLRILLNVISTSPVITSNSAQNGSVHAQNQLSSTRMLCRHVFNALKKYFEAHAEGKALELRHSQHFGCELHYAKSSMEDNVKTISSLMPPYFEWKPVEELLKLDGIVFLLKLIAIHGTWQYSGRTEAIRNALDVLYICSVSDRVKLTFCKDISYSGHNQEEVTKPGTFILLQVAAGYGVSDIEVRQAALNVIVMAVCGSDCEYKATSNSRTAGIKRKRQNNEDVLTTMWNSVRSNDGIMILCRLLRIKDAVPDADSIRALACEALCGLARCDKVMQILRKLPFISNGQLQSLMRDPVLKDKQLEHAKFVKCCTKLIEMAAGASISSQISNLEKAEIVAQTTIKYSDRQLLHLIAQHLASKGYHESAALLQTEAKLKPKALHANDVGISEVPDSNMSSGECSTPSSKPVPNQEGVPCTSFETPGPSHLPAALSKHEENVTECHLKRDHSSIQTLKARKTYFLTNKNPRLQKHFSLNIHPENVVAYNHQLRRKVTLDSIVSEYLRNQHAHCKTPCLTPPLFDLYTKHRCPEPRNKNEAPTNITLQMLTKQFTPSYWGFRGAKMNMKFLSRRFRNICAFHDVDGNLHTSCAFWSATNKLLLGTNEGNVKIVDIYSDESVIYKCHSSDVSSIRPLKNTNLFLTSGSWKHAGCTLWNAANNFESIFTFQDECYAEFSKNSNSHIIATKYERARIFDVETGTMLMNLVQPNLGNSYRYNRATFNYKDDLVLSDGVIWDVRSQTPIHKLDKFNTSVNGVFHPNCLEIISNSQVWDLRSYTLLRNVPELEQCKILFDQTGSVIFAAIPCLEARGEDAYFKRYGTSFRTFDADNYSCIGMKDVQKGILDFALDDKGKFLAVIQNRTFGFNSTDNSCNIYAIGRSVEEDDSDGMNSDDNEEDEEEEDEDYVNDVRDSQMSDGDNDDGDLQDNEPLQDDNVIERIGDSSSSSSESDADSNSISDNEYFFSFRT